MNNEDFYTMTQNMLDYGGSFVKSLGRTFRLADGKNREILLNAFPEYCNHYLHLKN